MVEIGEQKKVSVDKIIPLEENIREMTEEEFNLLCKSIEENGFVEPIQVVETADGKYRIVNGQHRFEALVNVFGQTEVPVVVVGKMCREGENPEDSGCWDEYRYWAEVIRLNNIRGDWIKPAVAKKILWLYNYYKKRGMDKIEFKEKLGFAGTKTLVDKLLEDVKKALPEDVRKELERKKEQIETVEDISAVVHDIMRRSGRTIKHNFIVFMLGGRQHIIVKSSESLFKKVMDLADLAMFEGKDLAELLERIIDAGVKEVAD